jgi:transposase
MMPARYVKPYVRRGKNDAVDAEAICEAVSRPMMRFCIHQNARATGCARTSWICVE